MERKIWDDVTLPFSVDGYTGTSSTDILELHSDGRVIAPDLTLDRIEAGGDKSLVTLEYVKATNIVFYVDPISGNDNDRGTTWATAFKTIKKGCDTVPAGSYGVIQMKEGTSQSNLVTHRIDEWIYLNNKSILLVGKFVHLQQGYILDDRDWDYQDSDLYTRFGTFIMTNAFLNVSMHDMVIVPGVGRTWPYSGKISTGIVNSTYRKIYDNCSIRALFAAHMGKADVIVRGCKYIDIHDTDLMGWGCSGAASSLRIDGSSIKRYTPINNGVGLIGTRYYPKLYLVPGSGSFYSSATILADQYTGTVPNYKDLLTGVTYYNNAPINLSTNQTAFYQ